MTTCLYLRLPHSILWKVFAHKDVMHNKIHWKKCSDLLLTWKEENHSVEICKSMWKHFMGINGANMETKWLFFIIQSGKCSLPRSQRSHVTAVMTCCNGRIMYPRWTQIQTMQTVLCFNAAHTPFYNYISADSIHEVKFIECHVVGTEEDEKLKKHIIVVVHVLLMLIY